MKVCLYARVSTDDHEQDPERQFLKCRQYAELHGHKVIGEFKDYHTGDSVPSQREGFSELMKMNPEGIIVFSIDRFSRQHPAKVMSVLSFYKDAGIKIISISEPIFNMESDFAEPMQYFLTWWNNYFLKKLRTDIKSGQERARKAGKHIGRPQVLFNERRAYHLLFVEHWAIRPVAKELGVSVGTVARSKRAWEIEPPVFINDASVQQTGGS